jgi:hypothetical protein
MAEAVMVNDTVTLTSARIRVEDALDSGAPEGSDLRSTWTLTLTEPSGRTHACAATEDFCKELLGTNGVEFLVRDTVQ